MNKLLRAGFWKYTQSTAFWVSLISAAVCGAACGSTRGLNTFIDIPEALSAVVYMICAAMISLNIGKEYSDGTIRNKLIVGHTKVQIFLSEMLIGLAACALVYFVFAASFSAVCAERVFNINPTVLIRIPTAILLASLGLSAMFVLISMLCTNKSVALIVILVVLLVMVIAVDVAGTVLWRSEMHTEKYISHVVLDEITGEPIIDPTNGGYVIVTEEAPEYLDPNYISEPTRAVLTAIYDILPAGAIDQYISEIRPYFEGGAPNQYDLYPRRLLYISAAVNVIIVFAGAILFSRKDIK